ncbi:MAG TPA: amidase [Mycobacteriales bacterium]|nr:amidase [Mycobacteriales bacterium]
MAPGTRLHDLSALEQADAVRRREVSSAELVEHCAGRIAAHDADVGAFVTLTLDTAREQAQEADRAVAAGEGLPPLHGVPTAIKDLNLTEGVPTGFGSRAMQGFVPPLSDVTVERLRAAGTISLGKTNTPEFGLPCYTETDVAPPARTPWDLTRSAGGSSGGAAAAVAAGLVPAAQGSDGGGSIRIPASVCGLYGLKPARGRISNGPLVGDITGLPTNGPITRTVADAAALLDALAGPSPGDPHWAPPPERTFLSAVGEAPGRLRVGRYCTPVVPDVKVHPHVLEAWEAASVLLEELGHEVVDVDPPFGPETLPEFEVLWSVSAAGVPVDPAREDELLPLTRWLREMGRAASATRFTRAMAALQLGTRRAVTATAHCDVVLTPTLAQPPAPVGWFREAGGGRAEFDRMVAWTPFTAVYNTTGQPAASLPLHWSPDGLPIGVMLVGRPADERTVLRLSAQLEAARPWRDRHPPLW